MPEDVKNPPDYWRVLTEPVPPAKGLPHLRRVRISDIKATGVQRAFSVTSYRDSPLQDVVLRNIEIDAKTAGVIRDTENWTFENVRVQTADGTQATAK